MRPATPTLRRWQRCSHSLPCRCTNLKSALQAIIDPYARGDFFISFGEEGVNLEEGYITFTALPAGFVAKVGKMRSAFGKVNTMHNHVLPWVDRPLVTTTWLAAKTASTMPESPWSASCPPEGNFPGSHRPGIPRRFRRCVHSHVSNAVMSARWNICAATRTSTNPPTWILEFRTRAAIQRLLGPDFLTNSTGWMPPCAGSRCAAPSTIRSSDAASYLEPAPAISARAASFRLLRLGGLPARTPLVCRRTFRSLRPQPLCQSDRQGRLGHADLLAERVQPGSWPISLHAITPKDINSNELLMQLIFSLGAHGAHPF